MERISAVYKIVNEVTGDFYIGSSKNVKERWRYHKKPCSCKRYSNSQLYQDMQKYGVDKFRFQILVPVMPECLRQVEQELIDMLKPTYNNNNAKGWDTERYNEDCKRYYRQLCFYNGQTLKLGALIKRFQKSGIPHSAIEAKKYLIKDGLIQC